MKFIYSLLFVLSLARIAHGEDRHRVSRVILVGLDGVSADGLVAADTPHLDRLRREGASTLSMRAVMPTGSLPNWASFLTGAGPEQHGITDNGWRPDRHALSPTTAGSGASLPTLFSLIRHERPDWKTAAYLDWDPIARFLEPEAVDVRFVPRTGKESSESRKRRTRETLERMLDGLQQDEAQFLFIHLDLPDHHGHRSGWGSAAYLESIAYVDRLVGRLLKQLDDSGGTDDTLLLILSDHGGSGTGHGGATDAEVRVPWILRGPGVRAGMDLGPFTNVYDTAPTVAAALGARQPAAWIGRPLLSAFTRHPIPTVDAPRPTAIRGIAGDEVTVRFSATAPDGGEMELLVDWGDGSPIPWTPPSPSGTIRSFSHRYTHPGTYTVYARAAADARTLSNATPVAVVSISPDPARPTGLVGLWKFGDPENPGRATVGEDLVIEGRAPAHHPLLSDGRGPPRVAAGVITTAGGAGNHLRARHNIGANGGGTKTRVFSLVVDVMPPEEVRWHTFYQTDPSNRSDAVFFMRPNPHGESPPDSIGRGGIGYSPHPLARNRWQRVVLTVDLSQDATIRSYVDGELFHEYRAEAGDSRWALDPREVLFFADQDGENTPWAVSTVALFDHALDAEAVRKLGAAGEPVQRR